MKSKYYEGTFVFFIILLFSLHFGLNYGVGNQNTYLIQGLQLYDSSLLVNDWFASQTTHYHHYFAYITYFLYSIDQTGWSFAVASHLLNMLTIYFIYLILASIVDQKYRMPVFLLLVTLIIFSKTFSISYSFITTGYIQPSSFGALGFLGGYLFFFKRKYFVSSLFIGFGGLLHANFLLLSFPLFFIALLLIDKKFIWKNCISLFLVPSLCLIPLVPMILETASSPNAELGRKLFLEVLHPHHYVPVVFWKEFIVFFAWLVLSLTCGWNIFYKNNKYIEFKTIMYSSFILIAIATLLTTIVFIPTVSQLYVWRLAPFLIIQSQIIFCFSIGYLMLTRQKNEMMKKTSLIISFICMGILCLDQIKIESSSKNITELFNSIFKFTHYEYYLIMLISFLFVVLLSIAYFKRNKLLKPIISPKTLLSMSILIFLVSLINPFIVFERRSNLPKGNRSGQYNLYEWARNNTNKDSVFLIPLDLENFRLHAQRAVVVDWISTPIIADELLEWYQRIQDVSGLEEITNVQDANNNTMLLKDEYIYEIANKYSINYIVLNKEQNYKFENSFNKIYENKNFIVLKI